MRAVWCLPTTYRGLVWPQGLGRGGGSSNPCRATLRALGVTSPVRFISMGMGVVVYRRVYRRATPWLSGGGHGNPWVPMRHPPSYFLPMARVALRPHDPTARLHVGGTRWARHGSPRHAPACCNGMHRYYCWFPVHPVQSGRAEPSRGHLMSPHVTSRSQSVATRRALLMRRAV